METTFSLSETSTLHRGPATSPPDHQALTSDDAPSSWINLRTLKDAIRLSSNNNEHSMIDNENKYKISSSSIDKISRQRTGAGCNVGDGLRQYLMFKSAGSSQDTPGSLRESARQYLEGSSEGLIDKVTIEVKSPSAFEAEHVDTPTYRGHEEPHLSEIGSQGDAKNQFKRQKNKRSAESIEKPILQSQPLNHFRKQSQLIDLTNQIASNEKFKRKEEGSHIRLQILDDGSAGRPPVFYKTQLGSEDDDDKENVDPTTAAYPSLQRQKRNKSASLIDFNSKQLKLFHSQSSRVQNGNPDFASKFLDNAMADFDQRIQKLKFNSYVDLKAINQVEVDVIELEDISPEKMTTEEEEPLQMPDQDQSSQSFEQSDPQQQDPVQLSQDQQLSFKRQNSMHRSIDSQGGDHNGLRVLKRENHLLKLELERVRQTQQHEISQLKAQLASTHAQEVQDQEEEHAIIVDGMRTDYEERVETLRQQLVEQHQRHEIQMREQQMLFECRISEYRRQVEEIEREIEEVRRAHQVIDIPSLNLIKVSQSRQNRGPQQSHSLRSLQVQRNLFQFEDVEDDDRPLAQLQGLASYNSQNKLRSSLLPQILNKPPKLDQAPLNKPLKEVSLFNYSSNGQSSKPPLYHQSQQSNALLTYSKSKEQAMNFSFSDINRTESAKKQDQEILDKINQKQLQLIDAEKVCSHFIDNTLESPQADLEFFKKSERNSPSKKQRTPTLRELLDPALNSSMMPIDNFMSPDLQCKKGSQTTTNRKSRFFEAMNHQEDLPLELDDGCENAPDESGFVSDDLEYPQQRIINESSLEQLQYEEDEEYQSEFQDKCDPEMYSPTKDKPRGGRYNQRQLFMMTGKSESAIEDDDEEAVPAISMSKAINSSCINFKRNNMLPQISNLMTSRNAK